ncbi:acyltransferase domain-containing protein, partial [Streptomyces erythrochromogenes]
VSAAPEEVRELAARAGCVVANHNAPRQCVISGPSPAVAAAVAALREAGLPAEPIPVACAFHSEVVAGAAASLAGELARTPVTAPAVPVWSNTTAERYPATAEGVRSLAARQVAEPVRFVEQVEAMYAAGVRTFVEAGPGRVLSGLVGRILGERPHTAVPLDVPGEDGLVRLVTALAELTAAGVPVAPEALFRGRTSRLPDRAPRRPGWLVDGHLVRTTDGTPVRGGLQPARRVRIPAAPETGTAATGTGAGTEADTTRKTAMADEGAWSTMNGTGTGTATTRPIPSDGSGGSDGSASDGREEAVLEYLRGARALVEAQRDVLLAYLGTPRPPDGQGGSGGVGSVPGRSPQGAERTAATRPDPEARSSAAEETPRR